MTDMKKILILPLLLFFLVQGSMAQTPKWVEKAKRAVFSIYGAQYKMWHE